MQEPRDDSVYEGVETSHLLAALDAAMRIQKRKVIVGPADSVGILLFNTVRGGGAPCETPLVTSEIDQSTRQADLRSRNKTKHFLVAADRNH